MNPSPSIWSTGSPPQLLASRDARTAALRFPPYAAQSALSAGEPPTPLPSAGVVYSYTVIHPNPKSGEAPFALGYVDLPGPVRIFGRIRGAGVAVGARCQAVPDPQYGYAFQILPA